MSKNRELTEKKILNAVQKVLIEEGASNLGVNNIARKAGVSKVLIYRYFESYDQLILKYIQLNNPFPKLKVETTKYIKENSPKLSEAMMFFFTNLIKFIYENPGFKEILIWELAFSNEITEKIANSREEAAIDMIKDLIGFYPELQGSEFNGIASIITGGIFYLAARSKTVDSFTGINLKEDTDSILNSLKVLLTKVF